MENISVQHGLDHVELVDVRQIELDKIIVSDFCCRNSEGDDLSCLMDSIVQEGLLQYPNAMDNGDGTFLLLCGRRRYLACKTLGWQRIPCVVRQKDQRDLIFIALTENLQRLASNPVDEAIFLGKVKKEFGYTEEELGRRTGFQQSGVNERLSILELPREILMEVSAGEAGRLKFTHAVALAYLMKTNRSQKESEIRDLAAKVRRCQLTTIELKMLVKLITGGGYDRLPDKLRMLLFNHKYMTAKVANLYLGIEQICQEKEMQKYRIVVPTIRTRIADVICKAVKSKLLFDRIKQQVIDLIQHEAKSADSGADAGLNVKTVAHHFSKLVDEINISREKIIALSKDNPQQLANFKRIAQNLIKQLKELLANVEPDTNNTGN